VSTLLRKDGKRPWLDGIVGVGVSVGIVQDSWLVDVLLMNTLS
jgi:hypothetical protein